MSAPVLVNNLQGAHLDHLLNSGLSLDVVKERGYRSIDNRHELAELGFSSAQQRTPGILIPLHGLNGQVVGYQFRPDNPRLNSQGKVIKYETPARGSNHLDIPPRCRAALGDPAVPFFLTEGAKKADALASRGACVGNLTGVWGWRGKNEAGGLVILAEFDSVAFNGRIVYLAFDSDSWTNPQVKTALTRLAAHMERRKAQVHVIHLPLGPGGDKVGVDDYLAAGHSLDELIALAQPLTLDEGTKEKADHPVPGFILADGTVGEMVVLPDSSRRFAVASQGKLGHVETWPSPDGGSFAPSRDPLIGQVIHFAERGIPYESQGQLLKDVRGHIHRFLDIEERFEALCALYVLTSWVFDYLPSIPYLRFFGDWGTGKTRALEVVGRLCFRATFASGSTTSSPIFRMLDKFQGTLILDEADFKNSDAWVDVIKILNSGYRPGFPVVRSERTASEHWTPTGFKVFGPKLIATRRRFQDEALESRCLTTEMTATTRDDIPRVLAPGSAYFKEMMHLRGQLLTFRLQNVLRLKGRDYPNSEAPADLQPRLQEILLPLKAVGDGDLGMAQAIEQFIRGHQDSLLARRRESKGGRVLAALLMLAEHGGRVPVAEITEEVNKGPDAETLSSTSVGWQVKHLGFEREREAGTGRTLVVVDEDRARRLALQYGLPYTPKKGSQPSQGSQPASPAPKVECEPSVKDFSPPQKGSQKGSQYELISGCEGSEGFWGGIRNPGQEHDGEGVAEMAEWTG